MSVYYCLHMSSFPCSHIGRFHYHHFCAFFPPGADDFETFETASLCRSFLYCSSELLRSLEIFFGMWCTFLIHGIKRHLHAVRQKHTAMHTLACIKWNCLLPCNSTNRGLSIDLTLSLPHIETFFRVETSTYFYLRFIFILLKKMFSI